MGGPCGARVDSVLQGVVTRRSVVVRARVARCRPRFSPDRSEAGCGVPAGFGLALDRCAVALPIRGPIRGPIGGPIRGPLENGPPLTPHTCRSRRISRRATCPGCMYIQQGQDIAAGARRRHRGGLPRRGRAYIWDLLCRVGAGHAVTTIRRLSSRADEDGPNYRARIIPRVLLCRRNTRVASAVIARNSKGTRPQSFSFHGRLDIDAGTERPYR